MSTSVSPSYNAGALFTSRVIDAITDPIGGYFFQRFSTKWGKMRPWILFSAPLVAVTYFCLWIIPNVSEVGKFVYYFIFHSLFWTFMTATRIPHTALTVYIAISQKERDVLTQYRTLMEAGGLLLSIALHTAVMVLFKAEGSKCTPNNSENNTNGTNFTNFSNDSTTAMPGIHELNVIGSNVKNAYMVSAGIVAILCVATAIFLFFNVREVADVIESDKRSFVESSKMIIKYKPFLILTVATVASVLATQLLVPTLIAVLIKGTPMWLLFICAALGANTVACGYLMPWAMLPVCIDAFMLKTGTKPVEIFYTFFFLGAKVAQAIYTGLVQVALAASNFDSRYCDQPESVSTALRILAGGIPGVIMLISTVCLFFYPIGEKRTQEIEKQLQQLRESSANTNDSSGDTLDLDTSTEF
ncbi:unnamed protein product [Didymodactylos carnosus]|uniref:Uncharacterized protein n=1 Tax=Didymodactylos carnosus TaxID=1234261 RepID=A0A8S2DMP9_9BILA|nr:unnamed protein product [Didymodactylos carnosus]CAF3778484.1 unnamed protein product [Didymodactylos carnosus]